MSYASGLLKATGAVAAGVAFITVLPIFGAAGAVTSVGVAVGSVIGVVAVVLDEM